MILPRLAASASRSMRPSAVHLVAVRPMSTTPRLFSDPTISEQASKADAYHKSHSKEQLQKDTVDKHSEERRSEKVTAAPNDQPTESEDVAHADKNADDPQTLQHKTASKMSGKDK